MTHTATFTEPHAATGQTIDAARIPALGHAEAGGLAREELRRFLALVETLHADAWQQPTDCTEWTVRDILAHQAGSYAGFTSWAEFRRQLSARPAPGQMQVDALNARQLADRAASSPAELIAELREVGPKAIRTRQRLPWLLRKLRLPMGPPLGTCAVEYLTDLIYPRDTWAHRLDICRAAQRPFHQTPEHDGRLLALVLRDLARKLDGRLRGQSVIFHLTGPAGGRYRIGHTAEPSAVIKMDALEFSRLASKRLTAREALAQGLATVSGDAAFAAEVLAETAVPY
ncbi:MAG: maleylpyruvate isomerase family mycothiol-dependent enzyme [Anaerolineales bacterium]|nr:maleylpyruvate isomerase family mycothiol-dependent enzyme [Anaerolineales bacterium]